MYKILNISINPTTDFTLPWYDYSTLNAVEQCPRRGIVKYIAHKAPTLSPTTALDAGNAVHTFIAAFNSYNNREIAYTLFGKEFVEELIAREENTYEVEKRLFFALGVLDNYGFEDSELDKRRTNESIRNACYNWVMHQYDRKQRIVSVEESFDITIKIEYRDPNNRVLEFRYVGKMDLVRMNKNEQILPVDYKTTAFAISPAFWAPFHLSPQFTGYQLALRCLYPDNKVASYVEVEAILITPAKKSTALKHEVQQFERTNIHRELFFNFCIDNIRMIEEYRNKSWMAKQIHSNCGAYFKPCELLTFCNSSDEDRIHMLDEEMFEYEWNPCV